MIWRWVANLVLPRTWPQRVWLEPPVSLAFFDLKLRQELVPRLAADLYAPNPLFELLNRD